ncbi:uncharacterized protein F5891DRAFT_899467, partial [Suillus fuscotomentosus]
AIPPKVEDTFKLYCYVPYTTLTHATHSKAFLHGEDSSFVFTSDGLTAKGLDCSNELFISTVNWIAAAKAVEERTSHYWGSERGAALVLHHLVCFHCGMSGHLPADCTSETTTAGKPIAALATGTRSKHALASPSRKHFCFNWAIWGTFNETATLILSLPPGCVAATFDISSAYRIIPVLPSQQSSLCIFWNGIVYIDQA